MIKNRTTITLLLLTSIIIITYFVPKTKYVGTDFISHLEVPLAMAEWTGQDISYQVAAALEKHPDKFSNKAIAYQYVNKDRSNLTFIILDAGNFHHPNVCFTSAGFEIEELPDTVFSIRDRTWEAHTLLTKKDNESSLSFYWISIDKIIAHEWITQKLKQLYFSLLNKKRAGLMVRIDIPVRGNDIEGATSSARQFINELGQTLPSGQADYIFGQK